MPAAAGPSPPQRPAQKSGALGAARHCPPPRPALPRARAGIANGRARAARGPRGEGLSSPRNRKRGAYAAKRCDPCNQNHCPTSQTSQPHKEPCKALAQGMTFTQISHRLCWRKGRLLIDATHASKRLCRHRGTEKRDDTQASQRFELRSVCAGAGRRKKGDDTQIAQRMQGARGMK